MTDLLCAQTLSVPSLGIREIDDQHKQMIDHLERLQLWIGKGQGFAAAIDALGQLQRYAESHFAFEETFLRKHQYPGLEEHIAQHQGFVRELDQLTDLVIAGKDVSKDVLHAMLEWLKNHIGKEDMEYGRYLAKLDAQDKS